MVSNASEHTLGLWRIVDGEWKRFVYAYCVVFDGITEPITHAIEVDGRTCCCGRQPVVLVEPRPTDTPSGIECEQCSAYLLGRTL